MIKLILKILLINIGLFVCLIVATTFLAFGMGYASKNAYNKQLIILYSFAALIQVAINYLIYKKQIAYDWRLLAVIIFITIVLYTLYPFIMK
jgi:hypothetical protein